MQQNWHQQLQQTLLELTTSEGAPARLSIVGVGQELRGDDAAGVLVARRLRRVLPAGGHVQVIEAGAAPENCTGAVRRWQPALLLLLDAVNLGQPPGSIGWVEQDAIDGVSASTHTLPLHMVARYLAQEVSCRVALVGIQPAQMDLCAPLTPVVLLAVRQLTRDLLALLA